MIQPHENPHFNALLPFLFPHLAELRKEEVGGFQN